MVLGITFFFRSYLLFHILFGLLFPFSIWTFNSLFYLDISRHFETFRDISRHLDNLRHFEPFRDTLRPFETFRGISRHFKIFRSFFDLSNRGLILDFFQFFFTNKISTNEILEFLSGHVTFKRHYN